MNSTDLLLRLPIAGGLIIRTKAAVSESVGRHTLPDFSHFPSLSAPLCKPFQRLCTLLLEKGQDSPQKIDGMMHLAERAALTGYGSRMTRGQDAVELGSWTGVGTCFLALGAQRADARCVYAVDTFAGSTTLGFEADRYTTNTARLGGDTLKAFYRHLQLLKLVAKVRVEPLVGTTTQAADRYDGGPVGLLLVDADHSYESCKADFLAWERHLAPDAIVMFHDYHPNFSGVVRAVDELVEGYPLESVETVCMLKIYRYRP